MLTPRLGAATKVCKSAHLFHIIRYLVVPSSLHSWLDTSTLTYNEWLTRGHTVLVLLFFVFFCRFSSQDTIEGVTPSQCRTKIVHPINGSRSLLTKVWMKFSIGQLTSFPLNNTKVLRLVNANPRSASGGGGLRIHRKH